MLSIHAKYVCAVLVLSGVLSGCGGGGGGGGGGGASAPSATTSTFNLRSAYQTDVATASSRSYSISGTCSGSARIDKAAAVPGSFDGSVLGWSTNTATTLTFSNCTPNSTYTTVEWYEMNFFLPVGSLVVGGEKGKFLTTPSALPTSVQVGSTGTFGTQTIYTNENMTTIKELRDYSYAVEAETSSSVILALTTKSYSPDRSVLKATQTARYRLGASATLTPLSIELTQTSPALTLTFTAI